MLFMHNHAEPLAHDRLALYVEEVKYTPLITESHRARWVGRAAKPRRLEGHDGILERYGWCRVWWALFIYRSGKSIREACESAVMTRRDFEYTIDYFNFRRDLHNRKKKVDRAEVLRLFRDGHTSKYVASVIGCSVEHCQRLRKLFVNAGQLRVKS